METKHGQNGLLAAEPTSADPILVEKYVCVTPEGASQGGMGGGGNVDD